MWCLPLHFTAPHTSLHLPPLTAADILSFISNILHNGNCLQFALVSHMNIYVVLSCLRILLGKGKTSLRGVGRDTEAEVLRENGQRNYFHRPQHEKKTQHNIADLMMTSADDVRRGFLRRVEKFLSTPRQSSPARRKKHLNVGRGV